MENYHIEAILSKECILNFDENEDNINGQKKKVQSFKIKC